MSLASAATPVTVAVPGFPVRPRRYVLRALAVLAAAFVAGVLTGPAGLPWRGILLDIVGRVPFVHVHSGLSRTEQAVLWQIRMPRVVLGGLVGWMLAAGG